MKKLPTTINQIIKLSNPSKEELEILKYEGENENMIGLKNFLLAFMITKVLNTDETGKTWEPDWDDIDQYKYNICLYMGSSGSGFSVSDFADRGTGSIVGSRLCFEKREHAEHALKYFYEVYKLAFKKK